MVLVVEDAHLGLERGQLARVGQLLHDVAEDGRGGPGRLIQFAVGDHDAGGFRGVEHRTRNRFRVHDDRRCWRGGWSLGLRDRRKGKASEERDGSPDGWIYD